MSSFLKRFVKTVELCTAVKGCSFIAAATFNVVLKYLCDAFHLFYVGVIYKNLL